MIKQAGVELTVFGKDAVSNGNPVVKVTIKRAELEALLASVDDSDMVSINLGRKTKFRNGNEGYVASVSAWKTDPNWKPKVAVATVSVEKEESGL